jgi:hypothetical protein
VAPSEPAGPRSTEGFATSGLSVEQSALVFKPRRYAIILVILAMQIALLIATALKNLNVINPDAVSYLRIAKYFLEGNIELAVSGYWGPLFSWILLPFLALGVEPLIAARLVMGISAIIFLLGSLRIFHVMLARPSLVLLAGLLTAIFTVNWSASIISPDLLMSGFLLLAIADTINADTHSGQIKDLRAGLLYGLAYLAKSVALPVSIGLIIILHSLHASAGFLSVEAAFQRVKWTLLALVLIALPWIVTLSYHYRSATFSTSAQISHAIVGPGDFARYHVYMRSHHAPSPGRITSWEDPDPKLYDAWSPFDSVAAFKFQVKVILNNLKRILVTLRSFELIGFGLPACVLGFLFAFGRIRVEPWRLSAPVIAITAGVYLPVYAVEPRYYIVNYPLLIAAGFGFADSISRTPHRVFSLFRISKLIPKGIAASLVIASFLLPTVGGLSRALRGNETSEYVLAKQLVDALRNGPPGPLASVGKDRDLWAINMYAAYLSGRQFLGNRIDDPALDELTARYNYYLIVQAGTLLDDQLRQSEQTQHILMPPSSPKSEVGITVYYVLPRY